MARLFGRQRELDRIEALVASGRTGNGSLVLLTGEAGIGKSSIGREVMTSAASAGMRVLSGRCWEGGGAAPYWPWLQVFRSLGLAPFEALLREDGGDSQQRRFQLFDAATRALTSSAAERPLLVFLDDLHAADLPSLLLLLFLARQVSSWPLLVLGTSREVEGRLSPEVGEALTKIGREGEVVSLERLTRDQVAAWIACSEAPTRSPEDVFRVTEGNPLFVHELLRVGTAGAATPASDGIKATLDEHLGKLSREARTLLEGAAVLGRDFLSRELAQVTEAHHDTLLERLRHASDLGVLEATERERYQFTHVLLRDRLYETMSLARRSELHWQAGLVAETRNAEPARIANHLLEGADAGDRERAATSALVAAVQALRTLAFEAATELANRGLSVLGAEASRLACQLQIACGEGLIRAGAIAAGRDRCARAAELAKVLGCAEEQARAALAYAAELTGSPIVDARMVRLLEEGLAVLGTGDSLLGARLGVRLAAALIPPRTEVEVVFLRDLARSSLAMARRLGDPETVLYVLDFTRSGLAYAIPSDEIFEITREAVSLARRLDQRLVLLKLGPHYAVSLLERGSSEEANAALLAVREQHAALDYAQSRWWLPMLEAGFALFEGRLDDAEQLGDRAIALAEQSGEGRQGAIMNWAVQRNALAIARGEPARIAPHAPRLLSIFEGGSWAKAHRAYLLAAIGRHAEARAALVEAAAVPLGFPQLVIAAEVCVLLQDPEAAARLHDLLRDRSFGMSFFWGAACAYAFGPTSRLLGELAQLLGRKEEARRHYEDAIALCRRIGAQPFLALSLAALERLEAESIPDPALKRVSSLDCLSEETIAALVDGSLQASQLQAVEVHLAHCDDCLGTVASAANACGEASEPTMLPPAAGLDQRFERGTVIAEGGMGTVHAGVDRSTGRRVAIKRIKSSAAAQQPELLARFAREAEILRLLDHPNIVKVLAILPDGEHSQIVMEYASGGSLRQLLNHERVLPLRRTLGLVLELTDALSRAHHLHIIHRDLKPENILLAEDGSPRLTDFGLARLGNPTLTETGAVLGTVPYLSPEGLWGKALDERADLWALGVLLFEMLTGRRPFEASNGGALITAILHQPVPELKGLCPEAPLALEQLVQCLLEKAPERRLSSARQAAAAVEGVLRELEQPRPSG